MIENNESTTQLRSVPPELEAVLRRKGYILLVKGDAGTGKTNLALELMALLHSEGDSVHISTRTYPEKLSFQHALFPKLAAEPNVQFFSTLEFDPTQFVVGHKVISGLHDLLSSMENPLVVLDSWEGISDYIPAEARMKVEQSLMAVLEETGARLILVSEHSEANTTLDQLADAILILRQKVIDDRRLRELEIRKLRGVPIRQDQYLFTPREDGSSTWSRSTSSSRRRRRSSARSTTRRPTCPRGAETSMPSWAAASPAVRRSCSRCGATSRSRPRSTCP